MAQESIEVRSIYGQWEIVELSDFTEAMISNAVNLFGMDVETLIGIRREYMLRGGVLPITIESLIVTFGLMEVK